MSVQDTIAAAAEKALREEQEAKAKLARDVMIDIQTKVFDRAAAYVNLIMFGGFEGVPDLRVVDVKEKFGGLRYYVRHVPDRHALAIAEAKQRAEERSFQTCEVCGEPGRLVLSSGYWHTACPEHEDPRSFRGS